MKPIETIRTPCWHHIEQVCANTSNVTLRVFLLTGLIFVRSADANARQLPDIRIEAGSTSILVGEPLVFTVVYEYQQPFVDEASGERRRSLFHFAYLDVDGPNDLDVDGLPLFPDDVVLADANGLKYSRAFCTLYDLKNERPLFSVPGIYAVRVHGQTKVSNPLDVTVRPATEVQNRALALLSSVPGTFLFLEYGTEPEPQERSRLMAALENIVAQRANGTVIAQLSAARLGVDYFEQFHAKYPSFERFASEYAEGMREPLFEKARTFLSVGAELPGPFPIRERVLHLLVGIRIAEGDYDAAESVLAELGRQFPRGEYGRRAAAARAELRALKEHRSQKETENR